jgi:hypothetical protein
MMLNTGEKLASIQSKIQTIQERLEAGKAYAHSGIGNSAASSCSDLSWSDLRTRRSFFVNTLEKQTFYAHCCKIFFLLSVAVVHLIYLQPFLDVYSSVEDYSLRIQVKFPSELTFRDMDTRALQHQVALLNDHKKNIWMTIASMCVALSTSCFFLFLLPTTKLRRTHIILMGVVDVVAFATLPALMVTRAMTVEQLNSTFPYALQVAHKLLSAERLMNTLQCTIYPREKLPFCAEIVLKSLFPVVILKFLLILALFTLAYIGLAYAIEWCIRHWFPHSSSGCHNGNCHQCACYRRGSSSGGGHYKRALSSASLRSGGPLLRQYNSKSYVPILLPPSEKASLIGGIASVAPAPPLVVPIQMDVQMPPQQPVVVAVNDEANEEPIPAEPRPSSQ